MKLLYTTLSTLLLLSFVSGCNTASSPPTKDRQATQSVIADIALPAGIQSTDLPSFSLTIPRDGSLYQLISGDRFYGHLNASHQPNSVGIYYPQQNHFIAIVANFRNGTPQGDARIISPETVYTGKIDPKTLLPNGYGVMVAPESRYEGDYQQGIPSGDGKMILSNGDYAIGSSNQGKFKGTFYFSNGSRLKGELNRGVLSGTLIHPNGDEEPIDNLNFIQPTEQ